MNRIILFDGECHFCDKSVQFIIKRDPKACFKFASLQSDIGKEWLNTFHLHEDINSFILIENEKCYLESSAALRVCRQLTGFWKVFYLLLIIPKPIRNPFYKLIAKNRHKWFGKKDVCRLPSPEEKSRFL